MFSNSIFLAELVCFYLTKISTVVLSGCCTDINATGKIFTLLNFNITIIISNDIKYLTRISKTIKVKGYRKKIIVITDLNSKLILKLIPQVKLSDLMNINSTIEMLEKSLISPLKAAKISDPNQLKPLAFATITKREREILLLIFNGKKTKEIADSLFLSIKTIENHRNNILKKTKSKSMIHLMNSLCHTGFFKKG